MTSAFSFTGVPTTVSPPAADLCRISGYLTDHLGRVLKNYPLRVTSKDSPIVTANQAVVGEIADVKTDHLGFVQFDAYRGARIDVVLGSRGEQRRPVAVPDQATADLLLLLFPYLASVVLAVEDVTLTVGQSTTLTVTGTLSDGRTLEVSGFCTFTSSTPAVVSVSGASATGLSAGVSTLSVTVVDTEALYLTPPGEDFVQAFTDARDKPFVRKDPPAVALGAPVAVTVA